MSEIVTTSDGSITLLHPLYGDSYHSLQGAKEEAYHVYIYKMSEWVKEYISLNPLSQINIFEMGFGTGLNALLTLLECEKLGIKCSYTAVELFPIGATYIEALNYGETETQRELLKRLHDSPWGETREITTNFTLNKIQGSFFDIDICESYFNFVYWDAFSPDTQPELWSKEVFSKITHQLLPNGALSTYSAKGDVKRALREVGLTVKRVKGYGTKHHMLLCTLIEKGELR